MILPGLQQQYEAYAGAVDSMLDAPSLVIVERILADDRRQRKDADGLRRELELPFAGADHLRARAGGTEMLSAAGA